MVKLGSAFDCQSVSIKFSLHWLHSQWNWSDECARAVGKYGAQTNCNDCYRVCVSKNSKQFERLRISRSHPIACLSHYVPFNRRRSQQIINNKIEFIFHSSIAAHTRHTRLNRCAIQCNRCIAHFINTETKENFRFGNACLLWRHSVVDLFDGFVPSVTVRLDSFFSLNFHATCSFFAENRAQR